VVAKLDLEVFSLKRKFASIEENYGADPDLLSTARHSSISSLDDRLGQMEERVVAGASDWVSDGKIEDIDSKLEELGDRLDKAAAKGTDESFLMEQFNFASYGDFANFMLTNKIPSCGMFWDIFSTLVSMRPKGQSGKERADEQHSSERINTSMLENNLLAAMGHARPGISMRIKAELECWWNPKRGLEPLPHMRSGGPGSTQSRGC
jgi:hypothetical protein